MSQWSCGEGSREDGRWATSGLDEVEEEEEEEDEEDDEDGEEEEEEEDAGK